VMRVANARIEIQGLLNGNPSFQRQLSNWVIQSDKRARYKAAIATKLPIAIFPIEPPCTWKAAMTLPINDQNDISTL